MIDGSTGAARANYWSVDALSYDWNPGGSAFVLNADKSGGHQTDYNCIQKAAVSAHSATDVTRCNPEVDNQWSTVWSPDGLLIAYAQGGLGTPQTPGSTYFIKPDGTEQALPGQRLPARLEAVLSEPGHHSSAYAVPLVVSATPPVNVPSPRPR
ncbi:MAG: hypothetical protein U0Q10_10340 [Dermatophilaceae bacterium]